MKKAAKILFIISSVLSYIYAVLFLATVVVLIVFGTPACTQILVDGLKNGTIHSSIQGTPEQVAGIIQGIFMITGCCSIPFVIFAFISGIVSTLGAKKDTSTIYILNIVFGVLSGVILNTVAGVLGLLAPKNE